MSAKIKVLENQNQCLKSQLGDLRKQLNLMKNITIPPNIASRQIPEPDSTNIIPLIVNSKNSELVDNTNCQMKSYNNQITSDLTSGLSKHKQQDAPVNLLQCSTSRFQETKSPNTSTRLIPTNSNSNDNLPSNQSPDSSNSFLYKSTTSHAGELKNSLSPCTSKNDRVGMSVHLSPRKRSQINNDPTTKNKVCSLSRDSCSKQELLRRQMTPCQLLAQKRVELDSCDVLLGDSVIKFVKSDLLFPYSSRHQTICIPGITVEDVIHWLRHIPTSKQVRHLMLHVGINSCLTNVITESTWYELIKLLKKCFPHARLFLSTIVPPMRRNNYLFKTVNVSNLHLSDVCKKVNIICIDNTSTFTTHRGLPKKALYHDDMHPSRVGTAKLACTLKYAILSLDKSNCQQENNAIRRPLLQTPDYFPSGSTQQKPERIGQSLIDQTADSLSVHHKITPTLTIPWTSSQIPQPSGNRGLQNPAMSSTLRNGI